MRHIIFITCFISLIVWLVFFQPASVNSSNHEYVYWNAKSLPNPKKYPIECNPTYEYNKLQKEKQGSPISNANIDTKDISICNAERILQQSTVDKLNVILAEVHNSQPLAGCSAGPEVAVAVVNRMAHSYKRDAGVFARELHDTWAVGDSKCNNGVVLFVSIEDREWYMSTGAALKNIISSDAIEYIGEEMKPLLKESNYDLAVETGVKILTKILQDGGFEREGSSIDDILSAAYMAVVIGVVLYFVICALVFLVRRAWYYGSQFLDRRRSRARRARAIDELERRTRNNRQVPATLCSICLDDFNPNENAEVLYCGHKFHTHCIEGWLDRNNSCPICRRRSPRESEEPQQGSFERGAGHAAAVDDAFLFFARSQLYTRYNYWAIPAYQTPTTHTFWNGNFGRSPSASSPSSSFGSYGSSSGSWGGGSSFGGGGGGGSW